MVRMTTFNLHGTLMWLWPKQQQYHGFTDTAASHYMQLTRARFVQDRAMYFTEQSGGIFTAQARFFTSLIDAHFF